MIKNVTYISAGAGSGKTHKLTYLLSDLIREGKVAPNEVILTTFTTKAAEDFKERAKDVLFSQGLYRQASELDNAVIGTINSVAMAFIGKYWFFLGLSPSLHTIDPDDVAIYQSQSLSLLPTDEEIRFLKNFTRYFNIRVTKDYKTMPSLDYDFWKNPLIEIIGKATNHSVKSFDLSRKKSKEFFKQMVVKDPDFTLPKGAQLSALIDKVLTMDGAMVKSRKKDLDTILKGAKRPSIDLYVRLGKFITGLPKTNLAKFPEIMAIGEKLCNAWQSEEVYEMVARYIDILFDLSERWRANYAAYKKANNLIDFDDQEKYFYELLQNPDCSEEISQSFKYVFVDEFQDCSPIQVKIFSRLSELVEHSYWVGDSKQAIYGFRASDTELTQKVVDLLKDTPQNGNRIETLTNSYRSVPEIVVACNKLFTQVFSGTPKTLVELTPTRSSIPEQSPLIVWEEVDADKLAESIVAMVAAGEAPGDIAVLARTKNDLAPLVGRLENYGVPVNRESYSVKESKATPLICSALNVIDNEADYLSKANVAFYVEKDFGTEKIIQRILTNAANPDENRFAFLNNVPLVDKLEKIRLRHKFQSLSQLVETVILEANLYEEAKKITSEEESERVIDTIIREAASFEESAERLGSVPSISAFTTHLLQDEVSVAGNPDGVNLFTIHGAKGLQWKKVIVLSLSRDVEDFSKFIKQEVLGVHFRRKEAITESNLFPEVYITALPDIFGKWALPPYLVVKIRNDDSYNELLQKRIEEEARLLYVAFTRAKDTLILTAEREEDPFLWLKESKVENVSSVEELVDNYDFLLLDMPLYDPQVAALEVSSQDMTYNREFKLNLWGEKQDYSPSYLSGVLPVKESVNFNFRIPHGSLPKGSTDADLGNCIHQIFHSFEFGEPDESVMERIIKERGFSTALPSVSEIIKSWQNLLKKIEELHGKIVSHHHERPFKLHSEGKVFTGSIDMTVETAGGTVLIDFKSCPMGSKVLDPDSNHFAGLYGGQLACYAQALRESGETLSAAYVYYPVSGILAQLDI